MMVVKKTKHCCCNTKITASMIYMKSDVLICVCKIADGKKW